MGYILNSVNVNDPYVLLNSLENSGPKGENLYQLGKSLLLKTDDGSSVIMEKIRFENVIHIIQQMALNEKNKEIAFIKMRIPDAEIKDYYDLINKISAALTSTNLAMQRLQEEKNRIDAYKNNKNARKKGAKRAAWSPTQRFTEELQSTIKFFTNPSQRTTFKEKIRAAVLRELPSELLASLSGAQTAALVTQITMVVQPIIKQQYQGNKSTAELENLAEIIRNSEVFQNFSDEALKSSFNTIDKIAKNTQYVLNGIQKNSTTESLQNALKSIRADIKDKTKKSSSRKWMDQTFLNKVAIMKDDIIDIDFDLTSKKNTGNSAEFMKTLALDTEKYIINVLTNQDGKPDVLTYYLTGTVKTNAAIRKILSEYEKNINIKSQSNALTTAKKMTVAIQDLEKEIGTAQKELEELKKCFIIHESVKDYSTAVTSLVRKLDGTLQSNFSGFGGITYTLPALIKALTEIDSEFFQGQDIMDVNWIYFALLNIDRAAIGHKNENLLSNYIASIATALLFDDGLAILGRAVQSSTFDYETTVNTLHLFPLNNTTYVPISYLLSRVADELAVSLTQDMKTSTVTANINSGPPPLIGELARRESTQEDWEKLRKQQADILTIRVNFLRQFSDIVENLFAKI